MHQRRKSSDRGSPGCGGWAGPTAGYREGVPPDTALQPSHSLLLHDVTTSAVRRLEALVAEAIARGDKVVHLHVGTRAEAVDRLTSWLPERITETGRLELVSAQDERMRTEGRHDALLAAAAARVGEARRAGYGGVTLSADSAALLDVAQGPEELLALERGLHDLADESGTTVLCCYPLERTTALDPGLPARLAAIHFERTHDELWTSRSRGGVLCFDGELEASNADRIRAVLEAALEATMHTIDLRAVTYASPRRSASSASSADAADSRGETLRLIRVPPRSSNGRWRSADSSATPASRSTRPTLPPQRPATRAATFAWLRSSAS